MSEDAGSIRREARKSILASLERAVAISDDPSVEPDVRATAQQLVSDTLLTLKRMAADPAEAPETKLEIQALLRRFLAS